VTTPLPVELFRPGRLADLARPAGALPWRLYFSTCPPASVAPAIALVRAAADRDAGPMRVGTTQHRAIQPAQAAAQLEQLRADITAGHVIGLTTTDIDGGLAQLKADPTRWLIVALTRVLTTQCVHLARWS
jgi:hypothetical protein